MQIGIRTMNPTQLRVSQRYGVKVFGPNEVAQALLALPRGPVYVSIDLDGLDPAFAPGVSHPEPGGEKGRIKLGVVGKERIKERTTPLGVELRKGKVRR